MQNNNSPVPPPSLFRRKKENRRGITYTMMLCGNSGTGKTTFANNLLESNIFPHQFSHSEYMDNANSLSSKVKIIQPTKVVSFNSKDGIPTYMAEFDPQRSALESGITITSTSLEITSASDDTENAYVSIDDDIISFNLINTYGINENLDDSLIFNEITSYLEQQFDIVLAEETRIRRNPRFEDTRVHIALYFIEPTGHGLREIDIELMKRISRYTNVLPIISKADSFTKDELKQFKKIIMNDVERFNVPIYKFEIDPDDDDLEAIEENRTLAALQPFSIVVSDVKNKEGKYIREYPWGTVSIDEDNDVSDLNILKNVLFGSHLQEFKDTTQNLLYENYRVEKLSTVSKNEPSSQSSNTPNDNDRLNTNDAMLKRQSAAPSLSNFASLVNTGHFNSQQSLNMNTVDLPVTPSLNHSRNNIKEEDMDSSSDHYYEHQAKREIEEGDSPIKQMSHDIKQGNEEIIRNIKIESSSPRIPAKGDGLNDIAERSKLRNISETVPYVLRHERILARQQKLEELEAQSAKELTKRIQELEKKAHDLKLREKLLKQQHKNGSSSSLLSQSRIKKDDTMTDLASILSKDQ
ncbi:septin SHS1 NDAI_0H03860 [Naumovozyma dairenensis CBS 421]|uniref:Septin-type G domain-containing protein n=1 Tax=Naumovozyma dairenensis (strain ATCC 10597 / BCRC 20456 / CBS 421 / NBRC 0211 / NRRL Y-12639) TaxID=1071378 RepID=G0WFJ8_NAUDC|nr:hypothetical protein NDAI_0H03860 [Naumovozyma dairenensis CBS 421]CCD26559.1 hypothetical protein NDAI_0H03860 [Naumovozyma dairenensis CBS 421]